MVSEVTPIPWIQPLCLSSPGAQLARPFIGSSQRRRDSVKTAAITTTSVIAIVRAPTLQKRRSVEDARGWLSVARRRSANARGSGTVHPLFLSLSGERRCSSDGDHEPSAKHAWNAYSDTRLADSQLRHFSSAPSRTSTYPSRGAR